MAQKRVRPTAAAIPATAPVPTHTRTAGSDSAVEIEGYRIVTRLGEGGCGVVYLVEELKPERGSAQQFAAKVPRDDFDLDANATRRLSALLEEEISKLRELRDEPSIAAYRGTPKATRNGKPIPCVLTRYLSGGELLKELDARSPLHMRLAAMSEVCYAVALLHDRHIVHGDLKPANLRYDRLIRGKPVLLDFGLAEPLRRIGRDAEPQIASQRIAGTLGYMAPERLQRAADCNDAVDVFALGVITFELLTGKRAFYDLKGPGPDAVVTAMKRCAPEVESALNSILAAKKLDELLPYLRTALALDPKQRTIRARNLAHWLDHFAVLERFRTILPKQGSSDTAFDTYKRQFLEGLKHFPQLGVGYQSGGKGVQVQTRSPYQLDLPEIKIDLVAQRRGTEHATLAASSEAGTMSFDARDAFEQARSELQDQSKLGFFLIGGPGTGKSTFLRLLALQAMTSDGRQRLGLGESRVIPVMVQLAAYKDFTPPDQRSRGRSKVPQLRLAQFVNSVIAQTCADCRVEPAVLAKQGDLLLLLDGLDEVETQRDEIVTQLCDARWPWKGHPTVVTCRPAGFESLKPKPTDHFAIFQLGGVDLRTAQAFVRKWFFHVATSHTVRSKENDPGAHGSADRIAQHEQMAESLCQQLRERRIELSSLVSIPLLLTMVCIVHRFRCRNGQVDQPLPATIHDLYEAFVQTALREWPHFRSKASPGHRHDSRKPAANEGNDGGDDPTTPDELRLALESIALYLRSVALKAKDDAKKQTTPATRTTERAGRQALDTILKDEAWAALPWEGAKFERFWQLANDESGLFANHGGADQWGFLHLGIEEHLAASALARDPLRVGFGIDQLVERFDAVALREVIGDFAATAHELHVEALLAAVLRSDRIAAFEQPLEVVLRALTRRFAPTGRVTSDPRQSQIRTRFRQMLLPILLQPAAAAEKLRARQLAARMAAFRQLRGWVVLASEAWKELRSALAADHHFGSLELELWARNELETREFQRDPKSGIVFVKVKGARFGFAQDKPDASWNHDYELQRHQQKRERVVDLADFWLATAPVTNEQYRRFLDDRDGDAENDDLPESMTTAGFDGPQQPVTGVTALDCEKFCRWCSSQSGPPIRLPTADEWEYACVAGNAAQQEYWSGNGEEALAAVGWYAANSGGTTHLVGQKPPNAFGLHDLHGNVWEWCADDHPCDAGSRVVRGGSFAFDVAAIARSAFRNAFQPGFRFRFLGFRAAKGVSTF